MNRQSKIHKYVGEQTGGYSVSSPAVPADFKPNPDREWKCPTVEELLEAFKNRYGTLPLTIGQMILFGQSCMSYGTTEGVRRERFKNPRPLFTDEAPGIEPLFSASYKRPINYANVDPFVASMLDVKEVYRDYDGKLVCGYCRHIAEEAAASCDQQNCGFNLPELIPDYRGPVTHCENPHCKRDFETLKK